MREMISDDNDDGISEVREDDEACRRYSASYEIDIDDRFDEFSRQIADEVKERIELLKRRGVDMLTVIQ